MLALARITKYLVRAALLFTRNRISMFVKSFVIEIDYGTSAQTCKHMAYLSHLRLVGMGTHVC
jgi:hypothetical protein